MKECVKCKTEKSLENFSKDKYSKDGYWNKCKLCHKEYRKNKSQNIKELNKKYYQDNKDKILKSTKEHYKENKDVIKEYYKKRYIINKDKISKKNKEYREKNKEYLKEYFKTYRENNKEYQKEYYEKNKEILNKNHKKYQAKRKETDYVFKFTCNTRSLINGAFKRGNNQFKKSAKTETILGCTIEEFRLYIESKFIDGMNFENYGKWHLDHIKPLALATTEEEVIKLNHYTNFQPLWAKDNLEKGSKY